MQFKLEPYDAAYWKSINRDFDIESIDGKSLGKPQINIRQGVVNSSSTSLASRDTEHSVHNSKCAELNLHETFISECQQARNEKKIEIIRKHRNWDFSDHGDVRAGKIFPF